MVLTLIVFQFCEKCVSSECYSVLHIVLHEFDYVLLISAAVSVDMIVSACVHIKLNMVLMLIMFQLYQSETGSHVTCVLLRAPLCYMKPIAHYGPVTR